MAKKTAKRKRTKTSPRATATKKAPKKAPKKVTSNAASRSRRSAEEMIADLKNRIKEVEQKAAAKELMKSDSVRRTLGIVRSIGKALDEAAEEGNTPLRHALADAHKPLALYLEQQGMRLPKPRLPRGRKPRR